MLQATAVNVKHRKCRKKTTIKKIERKQTKKIEKYKKIEKGNWFRKKSREARK